MIKIIRPGQKRFTHTCSRCGCEFTYEFEDITIATDIFGWASTTTYARYVKCPDCGYTCYIGGNQPVPSWPTPGEPIPCTTTEANKIDPCKDCDWMKKLLSGTTYVGDIPCTWCSKGPYKVTCDGSISTVTANSSLQYIKDLASCSGLPNNCTCDTVSSSLRKCNCKDSCAKQARLKAFKTKLKRYKVIKIFIPF